MCISFEISCRCYRECKLIVICEVVKHDIFYSSGCYYAPCYTTENLQLDNLPECPHLDMCPRCTMDIPKGDKRSVDYANYYDSLYKMLSAKLKELEQGTGYLYIHDICPPIDVQSMYSDL